MCGLKHAFLIFALHVSLCALIEVTVEKKIVQEVNAQPVCTRTNMGPIIFVSCRISTGRHHNEECRLIPETKSDCEFDSRFSLVNRNQMVYLGLTGLKRGDSGSYTCECSYEGGTQVIQLEITVEAEEEEKELIATLVIPLAVASTLTLTAGIICALYCRRKRNREVTRPVTFELSRCETPEGFESRYTSLNCLDQDESYAGLDQTACDIHQTFSSYLPERDAETNPVDMIYETFRE